MGFLEYARSLFFEKDELKADILVLPRVKYPQLLWNGKGFQCIFPEPTSYEDGENEKYASLMGYRFIQDTLGKRQLASLFRASVFHLGAHVMTSSREEFCSWRKGKDRRLADFAVTMAEDVVANAYVAVKHKGKLVDLALANALALKRLLPLDGLMNPATKVMADLLVRVNTGVPQVKGKRVRGLTDPLLRMIGEFRQRVFRSFRGEDVDLEDTKLNVVDRIYSVVEDMGPLLEIPFLPHTENLGRCSCLSKSLLVGWDVLHEDAHGECLCFLSGVSSCSECHDETWLKTAEAEGIQVFNSWLHEKQRSEKVLGRYREYMGSTRFKDVEIPPAGYTEFLKIKAACKSEAHRLIESLLVARDAIDEDPRKRYGVLDLQEVIQVVASKSPRMDVFMLDENISKSYAWIVLLDASRSMGVIGDFALQLFIMALESANQLLLDPGSWGAYAFNDRFLVVKDLNERYNVRVKSRIGGIRFEGFTFMPDALKVAGNIIKKRNENLRLIMIISDGWPLGYESIDEELAEALDTLRKARVAVIGVGARSRRVQLYFRNHCLVYTLRDLKRKFSNLYMEASRVAVES
ncbi:hypothetical protein GTO27_07975 [Candidatus Bathyarchaeota archaeon]|nr:hypothetical protein [Candidatus Bathyarchaeota archaeon]